MNEMKPQEIYSIIKTMEELSKNAHNFESAANKVVPVDDIDKALEIVRRVTSGELAEVVHAHWVFGHTQGHLWMKCSHCLKSQSGHTATFDYCPNCGALMDGKDDSHA